jgi:hypothetical protein
MNDDHNHNCSDCKDPPGPGSVVRLLGKSANGDVVELCSRCWILRDRDANAPVIGKLKPEGKKKQR